ncbi:MAG: hypothetical protein ACRDOO_10545 [Actinomadura sp.]
MSHARDLTTADPVALTLLRRRFPGVCLWFGHSTRHWWAYVNGHLVEARTPEELGRRLDLAGGRGYDDPAAADRTPCGGAPADVRLRTPPTAPAHLRAAADH